MNIGKEEKLKLAKEVFKNDLLTLKMLFVKTFLSPLFIIGSIILCLFNIILYKEIVLPLKNYTGPDYTSADGVFMNYPVREFMLKGFLMAIEYSIILWFFCGLLTFIYFLSLDLYKRNAFKRLNFLLLKI